MTVAIHRRPPASSPAQEPVHTPVRRIRVRRRLGHRAVLAEVDVPGRGGAVRVVVLRHGEVLAERTWDGVAAGRRVLRVRLPRRVLAGPAVVAVDLPAPAEPLVHRLFLPTR